MPPSSVHNDPQQGVQHSDLRRHDGSDSAACIISAWRCRDAEETRHFYEDILGLPLVHLVQADNVPSTGEYCPYVHIFLRLRDGSHLAFFDLGDDTIKGAVAEYTGLGQSSCAYRWTTRPR